MPSFLQKLYSRNVRSQTYGGATQQPPPPWPGWVPKDTPRTQLPQELKATLVKLAEFYFSGRLGKDVAMNMMVKAVSRYRGAGHNSPAVRQLKKDMLGVAQDYFRGNYPSKHEALEAMVGKIPGGLTPAPSAASPGGVRRVSATGGYYGPELPVSLKQKLLAAVEAYNAGTMSRDQAFSQMVGAVQVKDYPTSPAVLALKKDLLGTAQRYFAGGIATKQATLEEMVDTISRYARPTEGPEVTLGTAVPAQQEQAKVSRMLQSHAEKFKRTGRV